MSGAVKRVLANDADTPTPKRHKHSDTSSMVMLCCTDRIVRYCELQPFLQFQSELLGNSIEISESTAAALGRDWLPDIQAVSDDVEPGKRIYCHGAVVGGFDFAGIEAAINATTSIKTNTDSTAPPTVSTAATADPLVLLVDKDTRNDHGYLVPWQDFWAESSDAWDVKALASSLEQAKPVDLWTGKPTYRHEIKQGSVRLDWHGLTNGLKSMKSMSKPSSPSSPVQIAAHQQTTTTHAPLEIPDDFVL